MQVSFEWIWRIIESSNATFHFDACDVLIELFKIKYEDIELTDQLKGLRSEKFLEIHNILH